LGISRVAAQVAGFQGGVSMKNVDWFLEKMKIVGNVGDVKFKI
jgi:hypothetical protein